MIYITCIHLNIVCNGRYLPARLIEEYVHQIYKLLRSEGCDVKHVYHRYFLINVYMLCDM